MNELKTQFALVWNAPVVAFSLMLASAAFGFWLAQQFKDGEIKGLQQRLEAYKDNLGLEKPEEIGNRLRKLETQFGGDWPSLTSQQESLLIARLTGVNDPSRLTIIYENDLALPLVKSLAEALRKADIHPKYLFKSAVQNRNVSLGYSPYGRRIFDALVEILAPTPVKYVDPPVGANFDEGYINIFIGPKD